MEVSWTVSPRSRQTVDVSSLCAQRLAEFLGDQMVKDAGLACKYIIACKPIDAPVTERAIPVTIFDAEEPVRVHFVRRWLKDRTMSVSEAADIRSIIDWTYYRQRLENAIQKIITIPAACQKISNPVPRVKHPDWLHTIVRQHDDTYKQKKLKDMFVASAAPQPMMVDIEDQANPSSFKKPGKVIAVRRKGKTTDRNPAGGITDPLTTEGGEPAVSDEGDVAGLQPEDGEALVDSIEDDSGSMHAESASENIELADNSEEQPVVGKTDEAQAGSAKWIAQRRAKWRSMRQVGKHPRHRMMTSP